MKTNNPINRENLKIRRKDLVLEIGSGHNPAYRANVLVEKNIEDNSHRGHDIRIYPHQKFIKGYGESLSFKDKEFDYVICNHVLEHVEDPELFIYEMTRVAKRGYIETPSLIGESLFPKNSHKWVILEIDNKLVFYEKSKIQIGLPNWGITFLNYLPYQSLALQIFYSAYHQANTVRYEWKDSVEFLINPHDEKYSKYFLSSWDKDMTHKIFPPKSNIKDLELTFKTFMYIAIKRIKQIFTAERRKLSLQEYLASKNTDI